VTVVTGQPTSAPVTPTSENTDNLPTDTQETEDTDHQGNYQRRFRRFCSRHAGSISFIAVGAVLAVGGSALLYQNMKKKKSEEKVTSPDVPASVGDVEMDIKMEELEQA